MIVLLILLSFKLVTLKIISAGLIGSGSIEPWKILIIFFGSALIATSADKSGIFDHISVAILNRGRGRGILLLLLTYCLSWSLSVFASNDVVILTLTPIIFYFSRYSNVNIIPLLFAEFIAANNGIFFITGNPVDTIIATSLHIDQLNYLRNTILPTLALSITSFFLLYTYFRKTLTKKYKIISLSKSVRNWTDAKLSLAMLAAVMFFLLISGLIKIELWIIILVGSLFFAIKDTALPFFYFHKLFEHAHGKFWRLHQTMIGMPWEILPFILTMFILMESLAVHGFFNFVSTWLSSLLTNNILQSSLIFGLFSLLTENIINNQPMAIMFSHIFANPALQISPQIFKVGLYAVILSGNAGASLTMVGSLAGLMWYKILKNKGLTITYWQFFKVGLFVVLPALLISFVVLAFTI